MIIKHTLLNDLQRKNIIVKTMMVYYIYVLWTTEDTAHVKKTTQQSTQNKVNFAIVGFLHKISGRTSIH